MEQNAYQPIVNRMQCIRNMYFVDKGMKTFLLTLKRGKNFRKIFFSIRLV